LHSHHDLGFKVTLKHERQQKWPNSWMIMLCDKLNSITKPGRIFFYAMSNLAIKKATGIQLKQQSVPCLSNANSPTKAHAFFHMLTVYPSKDCGY